MDKKCIECGADLEDDYDLDICEDCQNEQDAEDEDEEED